MTRKNGSIQLRLLKAKALIEEVEILLKNQHYTGLLSRLYYSCFNATKALLLTKELVPKSHRGVGHMLHEHFTSKGLFDAKKEALLNRLFKERIEDDYGDLLLLDEAEVVEYLAPVKEYVGYVEALINNYLKEHNS